MCRVRDRTCSGFRVQGLGKAVQINAGSEYSVKRLGSTKLPTKFENLLSLEPLNLEPLNLRFAKFGTKFETKF